MQPEQRITEHRCGQLHVILKKSLSRPREVRRRTPGLLCFPLALHLSTHPVGLHVVQPEGLPRALIHHVELVSVSHTDEIVTLLG